MMGKHKHKLAAEDAELRPFTAPYTGMWTLSAHKDSATIELTDIKSFELVDGSWFVSSEEGVTGIAIANWDYIQLVKDEK